MRLSSLNTVAVTIPALAVILLTVQGDGTADKKDGRRTTLFEESEAMRAGFRERDNGHCGVKIELDPLSVQKLYSRRTPC